MAQYEDVAHDIMQQIRATTVEAIFGEPIRMDRRVVIPVGKIAYGWGGGGGRGRSGAAEEGEGSGVGMRVKVKPIGFIEVTREDVVYRPIVDFSPALAVFGSLAGLALLRTARSWSKRRAAKAA